MSVFEHRHMCINYPVSIQANLTVLSPNHTLGFSKIMHMKHLTQGPEHSRNLLDAPLLLLFHPGISSMTVIL